MTSGMADTPDLGVPYCPECEPDRDPFVGITIVRYCGTRHPAPLPPTLHNEGTPGERVYLSGTTDAGGDTNRIMCDGIHRGKWPK
jgi:hypothetical protein